jgi:4-amino-4-deoxy-L-arabinose transferase-like glycosyltransferase
MRAGPDRGQLRAAALVVAVTAVLVLPPLGQRVVSTTDEARFLLYAREVLAQHAAFDVRLRGKLFREKPPLYAWTIAAASWPIGQVTEATAQVPVALAAIGAVIFTFLLGDRLFGRRVAIWTGLALATTLGFFHQSQTLLPDMLVVCFSAAATYWFWRSVDEPPSRGAHVLFYAALALAVYAKGPPGLLPLLIAALWLWGQHGARAAAARLWSPAGVLLFLAVTLTWLVPFLRLGSGTFAYTVLWNDWFMWFAGGPGRRALQIVRDALGFYLPWTLVAPLALACAVRNRKAPAVSFALLLFVVPLVTVILAAHYRYRYLVYATPGCALLAAWWADRHGRSRTLVGRVIAWGTLAAAAVATVAVSLPYGASRLDLPAPLVLVPLFLGIWVVALSVWAGLHRGQPALLVGGVIAGMVAVLGYGTWVQNARESHSRDVPRLAARLEQYAHGGGAGVLFESGWLEVDFYLGRPLHEIWQSQDLETYLAHNGQPVLASERTWATIRGKVSPRVRVLERFTANKRPFVILGWAPES